MPQLSPDRELIFLINDLSRTIRTYVDHEARRFGMTRAQRAEGLKENELAGLLDLQSITLTRLIDPLCDNGLIERRNDPKVPRAKRLFLTPAAQPVLDQMSKVSEEMTTPTMRGTDAGAIAQTAAQLRVLKDTLREAIQARSAADGQERRYG